MYVCQHLFQCEQCGKTFKNPDDAFVLETKTGLHCSHGPLKGIVDARGRSSIEGIADAMGEVERFDCMVKRVIVSGKAWMRGQQHDVEPDGKLKLFGAEVVFDSVVYVWDEEFVEDGVAWDI